MAITKGKDVKLKDGKALKQEEIITDKDPRIREVAFPTIFPLPKKEEKLLIKMIDYVRSSQDPLKAERREILRGISSSVQSDNYTYIVNIHSDS